MLVFAVENHGAKLRINRHLPTFGENPARTTNKPFVVAGEKSDQLIAGKLREIQRGMYIFAKRFFPLQPVNTPIASIPIRVRIRMRGTFVIPVGEVKRAIWANVS